MTGTINGRDVIFNIKKDDVYTPFACAKELSIDIEADKISTKTVGSGYWKKYDYQSIGWSVNLSSILKFDVTKFTGWDFLDNQVNFIQLDIELLFRDTATNITKRLRGRILIEKNTIGATSSDLVTNELSLPGSGPLTISNPADDCFITITGIALVYFGGHRYIRVTGHTGSVARYDYEIDGGGFDSHFPVSFIPDLVIQDALPSGTHHVTIIPYCANGFQGTQFDSDFEIPIVYEVHGKITTGSITDACGGIVTALYGSIGVGQILYYDEAHTMPAVGYDYLIEFNNIYNLNSATGAIVSDSGVNCPSPIRSRYYAVSNDPDPSVTCASAFVRMYRSGSYTTGTTMYYDEAFTIPVTDWQYISVGNGDVVRHLGSDGVIGTALPSSTCTRVIPFDYRLAVALDICDAPIVTYYTSAPFGVGVIVYTDLGLVSPLLTYDEFANADTGIVYNMDDTTGQVLTPTGVDCTPSYVEVLVKLGNDSGTVCDGTPVTKYMSTGFAIGETLYNNNLLNDATVGLAFVVGTDGHIYNLNNTTGVIGSDTGVVCGTAHYSMFVSKDDINDNVSISVTDLTTSSTVSYNFNEDISSKDFIDIFIAGHLYDIQVNNSATRIITIQDGAGGTAASGNSTVIAASAVNPATAGVNITIVI